MKAGSLVAVFLIAVVAALAAVLSARPIDRNSPTHRPTAAEDRLIVVELYQSQGCSSCPPANAALNAVADRADVIALSFAVTYWDRLGWKDTFADPLFTQRQYAYAKSLGNQGVYTPQMVINGSQAIVGSRRGELARAIDRSASLHEDPDITVNGDRVTIGSGKGRGDIVLVRYDPRTHFVAIGAGENGGRRLPHRNIVRQLIPLGKWNGQKMSVPVPVSPAPHLKSLILLQDHGQGPIITARRLPS